MSDILNSNNAPTTKKNRISASFIYAFSALFFLTATYLCPELIRAHAVVYVVLMVIYAIFNRTNRQNVTPIVYFWLLFSILGLVFSVIYGKADIVDSLEFVFSILMGLIMHVVYSDNKLKNNLLSAVFFVSVVALIGCVLQLITPDLLAGINQITLGSEKFAMFHNFLNWNYLVGFSYQTGATSYYLGIFAGFILCELLLNKNNDKLKNFILFALFIISYIFIFLTQKRAALLIVAILAFLLICYRFRKNFLKIFFLFVLVAVGMALLFCFTETGRALIDRTFGSNPTSSRNLIYAQLISFIKEKPIFGHGFGNTLAQIDGFTNGHNIYLQVLSENGIVGFSIFTVILLYNLLISYRLFKMGNEDNRKTIAVCIYVQLYFIGLGMIGNPLYDVFPFLIYMIATGIVQQVYLDIYSKVSERLTPYRFCKKVFLTIRGIFENNVLASFFKLLPLQNIILFESVPDLSDNSKAVFDEMLRLGVNKQYRMVWLLRDKTAKTYPEVENVSYILATGKTFKERMKVLKLENTSKCLISCNLFLVSKRKKQKSFYLTHGTPIKYVRNYCTVPKQIDYCLVASPKLNSHVSYQLKVDENKLFSLGFPRNDILTKVDKDLSDYFETNYKKIIVWYPTFRQHKTGGNTGSRNALPIIHDQEKATELNRLAFEQNTLIVVKPHFAQDISYITDLNLSNIVFISDEFFSKHNLTSYEFVGSCDALITDYSSIFFDYLLCDKPVGVVWEDFDEYKQNPGFAVNMDYYMQGAEKIYSLDEFKRFINNVANGNDIYAKQRNYINGIVNYSSDGKNSERVATFIMDHLKSN